MLYVSVLLVLAFVVVGAAWLRIHAFLVLLVGAAALALLSGLPVEVGIRALLDGFGGTARSIGIVIAGGAVIGVALERSGGAEVLAGSLLSILGQGRVLTALGVAGAVVSIPVFCDSGFILLAPVAFRLADRAGKSRSSAAVMLAMGLYFTHVFVPPTPGPVAAAAALKVDLAAMIGFGIAAAVPGLLAVRFAAERLARWADAAGDATERATSPVGTSAVPHHTAVDVWRALLPILLPVALMGAATFVDKFTGPGALKGVFVFVGEPAVALVIGALLALVLATGGKTATWTAWTEEALRGAGPIVLVTSAGGALGGVIKATPLAGDLGQLLDGVSLGPLALLAPFATAALMKTLIGSSTVSMATTAPLMATLLPSLGLESAAGQTLAALAVAAGAMVVSHPNDSYFWVVKEFGGMGVGQTMRLHTTASAIAGLSVFAALLLVAPFVT